MRTATILAWGQIDWWPENLFRGCCPCICLTLKLLSQLWRVVRDCVFLFFFPHWKKKKKKQRWCTLVAHSQHTRMWCVFQCSVRMLPRLRHNANGCEEAAEGGEIMCANPYLLWRIQGHPFMFCQPSVNHFPIKGVLNSAVIPISSSCSHLTVSEVLKHLRCLFLWSPAVCPTRLARPNPLCQAL